MTFYVQDKSKIREAVQSILTSFPEGLGPVSPRILSVKLPGAKRTVYLYNLPLVAIGFLSYTSFMKPTPE